jgi:ORF6N domain
MAKLLPVIPVERIASRIYLIRGEKIMLDSDLAQLYQVKAIALRQQVKRNIGRFPEDFMFQPRRSPRVTHLCSVRVTHMKNSI